ncbi:MAG: hypothetical protein K1X89_06150 [Myxococcaceae bacterium]|nr:hypothetical protein [Myxococcaceae bacterium]
MIKVCALVLAVQLAAPLDLRAVNQSRLDANRTAMTVLASWATANLVAGLGAFATDSPRWRAFFLGGAAWNVVNEVLAGVALGSLVRSDPGALDFQQSLNEGLGLEKTYLFNAGLDVAYLAAAGGLMLWGRLDDSPRLTGLGNALLLQGAFLLVFDSVMALVIGGLNRPLVAAARPN